MESISLIHQSTPVQEAATEHDAALLTADSVATRALGDAGLEKLQQKLEEIGFGSLRSLVLSVRDSKYLFTFDADSIDDIGIGRYDYHTGSAPMMDLADYGGGIKGVSREHAAILRRHGSLYIVDKGSSNGTYLNGQRLPPGEPRILCDGDDVSLGQLVFHVAFVSSN